jgi:hypothetical protein
VQADSARSARRVAKHLFGQAIWATIAGIVRQQPERRGAQG